MARSRNHCYSVNSTVRYLFIVDLHYVILPIKMKLREPNFKEDVYLSLRPVSKSAVIPAISKDTKMGTEIA